MVAQKRNWLQKATPCRLRASELISYCRLYQLYKAATTVPRRAHCETLFRMVSSQRKSPPTNELTMIMIENVLPQQAVRPVAVSNPVILLCPDRIPWPHVARSSAGGSKEGLEPWRAWEVSFEVITRPLRRNDKKANRAPALRPVTDRNSPRNRLHSTARVASAASWKIRG